MSRIGKMPVTIPAEVEAKISGQQVEVKGPKGSLSREIHEKIAVEMADNEIKVTPREETQECRALWGLSRSLIFNMVEGVSKGYSKVLEINGVGYRAEVNGQSLKMALGFSHPVEVELPAGIEGKVDKNTILTLSGIDKELLGQTAATIRAFRPPEPYKGKGIKYANEVIRRKVGKTGVK